MIFKEYYKPFIEDFTTKGSLSLNAILKIFENTSNGHSEIAGDKIFNYEAGRTHAWILTDWYIEIISYPVYGEELKAETWLQDSNSPLISIRNFILYKNNQVCVKGTTKWVLIDLKTERLCKLEKDLIDKYQPENKTVFEDSKFLKLNVPQNFEFEVTVRLRRSDYDFNNHIHNLVYLDYAFEVIPEKLYKEMNFKSLRINYKSAVKTGTEVIGKYAEVENKKIVCIYDVQEDLKSMIIFE